MGAGVASDESLSWTDMDLHEIDDNNTLLIRGPSGSPWDQAHTTYLAHQLSIEYRRQSTEGYPAMVDLSVEVRVIRNRMVTQGAETTI